MIRFLFVAVVLGLGALPAEAQLHALCKAAMDGDTLQIATILDAGAPVDECYTSLTPLMFAAGYGRVDAARLLLERGADPARRDVNRERALMRAAVKGHADVIELLLAAGEPADSADDPYGVSPLHAAALAGRVDAARVLLAAGADAGNRDQGGETPLHAATTYGFAEIVAMLLAAGADPNAVDRTFGRTPVHKAAADDDAAPLARLLEAGGDPSRADRDGRTPLHHAAAAGSAATAALLLSRGVDPDARDGQGRSVFATATNARALAERRDDYRAFADVLAARVTDMDGAFAEAVWVEFERAAATLAARGANATGRDSYGRSALAGAAASALPALLELALVRGASVEADGGEALATAAVAGRDANAKRLLDLGVPVDARTAAGRTALQLAATEGHVGTAALLIERGADRNPVDAEGNTIEMLMAARRALVEDEIEQAGMSAALIPTEHLEEELSRLTRNHAAILVLLGR
ncbi:MAG: ankyrin repeat domain-containing protein [Rhizobiaceae bacterium]|nr:ankyrin repeat domain-containing protein [Rhizobiaceae bacterium]